MLNYREGPGAAIMFVMMMSALSCNQPLRAADDLPKPNTDLPAPAENESSRTAVFAGGCFWCTEAVFEDIAGVSDVVSGYAGGTQDSATYEKVSNGVTTHAESIRITYDPRKVSYGQLLRVFFATHDPTTKDRQGPDWGRQYRSAIFYENDEQKRVAQAYIQQLDDAKVFKKPIVTELEPLGTTGFYTAEEYHQNFVAHNPDHPYVRQWSVPKQKKLREHFPQLLKQPATAPSKE